MNEKGLNGAKLINKRDDKKKIFDINFDAIEDSQCGMISGD
jgi:hypothetical protein